MGKHKMRRCPSCNRNRPTFVIKKKKCDVCSVEVEREVNSALPQVLRWKDVKAKCRKLIQETDWALLPDIVADGEISKERQQKIRTYRKALRDIKNGPERNHAEIDWPPPP